MWNLLRAEINYNKIYLVLGYLLYVTLFAIVAVWGKPEHFVRDISIALWAATLFGRFSGEFEKTKNKRIRYHLRIPLTTFQIGLLRLIFTVVYWLSIVALFFASLLLVEPTVPGVNVFWALLPINGLILLGYAGFSIYHDLKSCFLRQKDRIVLHAVWFLMVFAGYFLLYSYMDFLGLFSRSFLIDRHAFVQLYFSGAGVLLINLTAVWLSGYSLYIFVRRKSYLE